MKQIRQANNSNLLIITNINIIFVSICFLVLPFSVGLSF